MRNILYIRFVKRLLDVVTAVALFVLLSPLLFATAMLVHVKLGAPFLYTQQRIGRGNRQFLMVKFRTMTDERDSEGKLLPDEFRLTKLGRLLRASSLDELPELWNVLRGEMSLVGPRPLLVEYLPLYTSEQARRHEVLPGITGLAQVRGRNAISWEEKFQYDSCYVQHVSAGLDFQILANTMWTVLSRQGVSADVHSTMPPFTGTETCDHHSEKAA